MPTGVYIRTEEHRKHLSEALKGKNCSLKTRKKISEAQLGTKNHMWKGRRLKKGYVYVYCPTHPFKQKNGYILEHRFIMEQWLRKNESNHPALIEIDGIKYLRRKWIPHHINAIKDDNRIENLKLMTLSGHSCLHTTDKHPSKKTRMKMSLTRKAMHLSEETKRKISEGNKRAWREGRR